MVDQKNSTPLDNSSADEVSIDDIGSNRRSNVGSGRRKKKRISRSRTTPKETGEKWMKSRKQRRKFTFSSPEEYMEYAAARKSSVSGEIPSLKEGEKASEAPSKKSKGSKWMKKYRKGRKHTFSSPEEYMEYAARKSMATNPDAVDNRLAVAIGATAEYEFSDSESESDEELAGARTEDNSSSDDNDVESNNAARNSESSGEDKQKRCRLGKLSLVDLIKVALLWVVITTLILVLARDPPSDPPSDDLTCSLCSAGTSVLTPDLEIVMADFSCQSEESSCFFQCSDPLTPRVYTCGEVEQLAMEASSECSTDDSGGGCAEFQQAASQCCFSADAGWEETLNIRNI